MSKTTIGIFIVAAFLLVVSLAINILGRRIVESQLITAEGQQLYPRCDHCGTALDDWQQAASLMVLLAISVSIAGAMFWEKETRPVTGQASILKLNERRAEQSGTAAARRDSGVLAAIGIDESNTRLSEDETLTPLERVIRGY
jgi:hypothetical protein